MPSFRGTIIFSGCSRRMEIEDAESWQKVRGSINWFYTCSRAEFLKNGGGGGGQEYSN